MKIRIADKKHLFSAGLAGVLVAATVVSHAASPLTAGTGKRPNVVIVLGDDLGFADMGCLGGEIKAPNLRSLAKAGRRRTQTIPSSCNSRRPAARSSNPMPAKASIKTMDNGWSWGNG